MTKCATQEDGKNFDLLTLKEEYTAIWRYRVSRTPPEDGLKRKARSATHGKAAIRHRKASEDNKTCDERLEAAGTIVECRSLVKSRSF